MEKASDTWRHIALGAIGLLQAVALFLLVNINSELTEATNRLYNHEGRISRLELWADWPRSNPSRNQEKAEHNE